MKRNETQPQIRRERKADDKHKQVAFVPHRSVRRSSASAAEPREIKVHPRIHFRGSAEHGNKNRGENISGSSPKASIMSGRHPTRPQTQHKNVDARVRDEPNVADVFSDNAILSRALLFLLDEKKQDDKLSCNG